MDSFKKRTPDYTDIAYREAVARLRYLLAESYSPRSSPTKGSQILRADDSGDEIESVALSEKSRHQHQHVLTPYKASMYGSKRALYTDSTTKLPQTYSIQNLQHTALGIGAGTTEGPDSSLKPEGGLPPPELMTFIERQEEYIEQLEKESQYCRDELAALLSKVKEVISENEGLHEREKAGLLKSVFDCFETGDEDDHEMEPEEKPEKQKRENSKKRLEGPSIVFESRISELEAQLTQTKMDLRKALEEADLYKKKLADQPLSFETHSPFSAADCHSHQQQIESLQKEKDALNENLLKLQAAVAQFREKEAEASLKVKRSLDVVDQAQFEKAQAELEVRRLKDELDRQHEKMRELLQEQGRKVQDERMQLERRYTQQMEQLNTDLTCQWDSSSKLQLELEKQRRVEVDLRRDLQQKTVTIEELKKELQNKIGSLQTELVQAAVDRGSLEQELAASRLVVERAEREGRQEASRLQAEVAALRQRLDRADADLMHSRRENLRLTEQVASLEREVNLAKITKENADRGSLSPLKQKTGQREKELTAMIMDMEAKHVHNVAELEGMIQSQNQVMEKLKDECHSLTEKLEESSNRHKRERACLREDNAMLMDKLGQLWEIQKQQQPLLVASSEQAPHEQMMTPMPETPLSHRFIQDLNSMNLSSTTLSNISITNLNPVNNSTNQIPVNISTSLSPLNSSISLNPMHQLPVRLSRQKSHSPHLSLSPRRHEVVDPLPPPPPPLTLEDLATDSDS
ncbi:serologically defined colon cancer antigen 8 homolog isoform X3 [Zootermopsis nevadensis]|nr:serologically defined colon cancer antigen 8 homolog isoform X3 [Zootermopsis nevadensis]XP_021932238.1 serologically defined colon cancer antigen 8 homolog isoform X3 [Zootermopsis nevadensis]XP_021932239.1 serologically defined colon cancer antigen 8 homolog isoform X3 [Zootermopsis nevadensis]